MDERHPYGDDGVEALTRFRANMTIVVTVLVVAAGLALGAFAIAQRAPTNPGPVVHGIVFSAYAPGYQPPTGEAARPYYFPPVDIYVWGPKRATVERLTPSEGDTADWGPVVSPDGREIAFTRSFGKFGGYRVYVIDADGSHDHLVHRCNYSECASDPSWFPDSKRLIMWRTGSIWTVNADGTGAHAILTFGEGSTGAIALSPNGRLIAFHRTSFGSDLSVTQSDVVVSAEGTHEKALNTCPLNDSACEGGSGVDRFVWSPDSGSLVLQVGRNLWRIGVDGTGLRQLTTCPEIVRPVTCETENASFSPDGNWIAYDDNGASIRVMRTDGGAGRTIASCPAARQPPPDTPPTCTLTDPVWSPDGRAVAFVQTQAGSTRIEIVDRSGREIRTSPPVPGASDLAWRLPEP
jgi:Tol biopolymer transport system component